jgi:putative transposase
VKCAWIAKHSNEFPVAVLCRFMKVLRSRYYDWLNAPKTERAKENEQLLDILTALFQKGRGTYGTRRLKKEFALWGILSVGAVLAGS